MSTIATSRSQASLRATRTITGRAVFAWLVLTIITAALLGPLRSSAPAPDTFDLIGMRALIDRLGPSAPLLWIIRLAATAAAIVHLTLLTLALVARAVGAMSIVRLVDRISPAAVRRLLTPLTIVSLTGTMITGTLSMSAVGTASASTPTAPPPAVMVVAAPMTPAESSPASPSEKPEPATLEIDSNVTVPARTSPSKQASTTSTPMIGGTVVAARGDSLWSIAQAALHTHFGHAPTESETSRYWRALIDTNRDRLADAHDPGLIFAGQQFVLP